VSKNMAQKQSWWSCVLWVLLLVVAAAAGADESAEQIGEAKVDNADRVIALDSPSQDADIQNRLSAILTSSEQFSQLQIRVDNGLVFLRGYSTDADFIGWASDIAKNIDGVVAVVNNVELTPVNYFSVAAIKAEFANLWVKFVRALPLLLAAALTFLFFFFTSRPVAAFLVRPLRLMTDSSLIQVVLRRLLSIFILLLGFYFFLRIAGLTQFAVAVISGTGLLGLVVGFAFRDIAENFIASLLLSVQRPFRLGEVIEVSGFRGVVQKVTTRGTTLVDFDGNHIQIPNAIIYKSVIQNFSANPNVRGSFDIGVGYDAKVRFAQEVAMALMLKHQAVLSDPEPQVLIDSLGASTINLKIYFWVDAAEYSVVKVASSLMREVVRAFEAANVSMPDDAREVIFPQGVPWVDESTQPEPAAPAQPPVESTTAAEAHTGTTGRLLDDLASDTDDIQQQAKRSRDPEGGANII
jgi:small-conductance mechanosensitive channel